MGFGVFDLFKLQLKREDVPYYGQAQGKSFPEEIPIPLMTLCFFNSLLKLSIPMVLEETYSQISGTTLNQSSYISLIAVVVGSIALSNLVRIAYQLLSRLYRHNVRRQVSCRIISNNFNQYESILNNPVIGQAHDRFSMDLWIKTSTKLVVYLHNYYQSYLNLIFQCFNIVVILIYLFYKLSFSLLFGLAVAGLVMYKTITTTNLMEGVRFRNIELRGRRLKVLQAFFNRVTDFKMTWLDKWIFDRVSSIQKQFQSGLREIKLLDCWCVALWQFTGVGISSIVIIAYFLLGFSESVDQKSVFSPSTFIYLLNMLNYPLNALSWYIAGIRTAKRAISQIQEDVKIPTQSQNINNYITADASSLIIREQIRIKVHQKDEQHKDHKKSIIMPVRQLKKKQIYSFLGDCSEQLFSKLIFLIEKSINRSYVEQNSWMSTSSLEAICLQQNLRELSLQQRIKIQNLLQIFQCSDIPLHTNTSNYSGGQKLRVSLVRAFFLGEIVVINSNLKSLDEKMRKIVKQNLVRLVKGNFDNLENDYTVFIRDNEDIADEIMKLSEESKNESRLYFQQAPSIMLHNQTLTPSQQIKNAVAKILHELQLNSDSKRQKQQLTKKKLEETREKRSEQKSIVSLSTFKIYYKSKKHIIFIFSMLIVTFISNYYNYYINTYIKLSEYHSDHVAIIIFLTILFAIGLFFRSYYFADANLDEAQRICHDLNQNILMEQLQFYQNEEKTSEDGQKDSKSNLIYALTSDVQTISDHFPFSTNIFANNITVILSAAVVISIQVPQILILLVFLVAYANHLNQTSHKKDQSLKVALKEKEVQVYKIVSQIEAGKKYLVIHNKVRQYSQEYAKLLGQYLQVDWLSDKFRNYINFKYKSVMILFLIIGITLYSLLNILNKNEQVNPHLSKASSGLALLIQYTIQLSNYLLYFTMSILEIKGQAISIERVKEFLPQKDSVKQRMTMCHRVLEKIRNPPKEVKEVLLALKDLSFSYESNPSVPILSSVNLQVRRGDKIMIKGRSGSGKTTLYKLLTSAYPKALDFTKQPFHISYSPQHPLVLPDSQDLLENLNPYNIKYSQKQAQIALGTSIPLGKKVQQLNYDQKIILNNIRAQLYGRKGLVIYDQPQKIFESSGESTYLFVTHHKEFKHNQKLQLRQCHLIPQSPKHMLKDDHIQ